MTIPHTMSECAFERSPFVRRRREPFLFFLFFYTVALICYHIFVEVPRVEPYHVS